MALLWPSIILNASKESDLCDLTIGSALLFLS
jgi:hypothetical protein